VFNRSWFVIFASLILVVSCGKAPEEEQPAIQAVSKTEPEIHQGYSESAPQYEVDGWVISNVDVNANLWNPRGKSEEQILERAQFLTDAYDLERTPEQQERARQAREKYSDAIVINSVMIGAVGVVGTEAEHLAKGLKRNHDHGLTVVSVTAYAYPSDGEKHVIGRLEASLPVVEELGMIQVEGIDDIRRAKDEGKLAVVFNSQGADYAVEDLGLMEEVKSRGLRISGFTYNNDSPLAGGGTKQDHGVTELGKRWVEEMNRLNLVVDCSHASNQTCIDAARHSIKPIIASHSPAYGLNQINRNITDEAMIAIGEKGGAVCTTGVGLFLNPEGDASPEAFAKHVNYTGDLIGRDKTCYSTDYMHNAYGMFKDNVANVDIFPPEKGFGSPAKNTAAEHIWEVAAILEDEYGWSDGDVRGFLGENLMRVYKANWE
jgi:microsomal dipeptidase-like Zn-dependent dipeptidase